MAQRLAASLTGDKTPVVGEGAELPPDWMYAGSMFEWRPIHIEVLGGGDPTWVDYTALGVTALALIGAGLGVFFAWKAWDASRQSLKIAQDEHDVFVAQLTARAVFELSLEVVQPVNLHGTDNHFTKSDKVDLAWKMEISNVGNKAATKTGINFLVPSIVRELKWTTQNGEAIPDLEKKAGPNMTMEALPGTNTLLHFSSYLIARLDRIGVRRDHIVLHASGSVALPNVDDHLIIPAKFKAWADELEDDVEDVSVLATINIVRVDPDEEMPGVAFL